MNLFSNVHTFIFITIRKYCERNDPIFPRLRCFEKYMLHKLKLNKDTYSWFKITTLYPFFFFFFLNKVVFHTNLGLFVIL